ncbi:hypothetical protein SE19_03640 [Acidiplasma aeolicum]|jgi:ATP-binding cassette subfamily B protein|uniref:Multidrug ABC transporter ATP-binding protein n=2 Tax=Acidiplasma TaxID=507753 RepID=A0A0Q0VT62_9ARCH|nr:ABC transporter ATP-binding protein [Acidiplasma aeolicum]KPV46864.1 hypothetical protein SE19_03640 [Acidiplasma aeolicum]KQB34694.1 hypothetical protein AOG54_03950 [Acidiplasma aeolicum]
MRYRLNDYSIIFRNVRGLWHLITAVVAASILFAYFSVLIPLYIGDAVNSMKEKNFMGIYHFSILILFVSALVSFFIFIIDYYSNKVSQRFIYNLRREQFEKVMDRNYEYFMQNHPGDTLSKFTMDMETLRRLINMTLSNFFSVTFLIIVAAIDLTRLYYGFTLIFFAVIIPVILLTVKLQRSQRPYWRGLRSKYGYMNDRLNQNIAGNRVVRSFNAEDSEINKFNSITDDYYGDYKNIAAIRSFYVPLSLFLISMATGFIIIYGGYRSVYYNLSIGSIIAAVNVFAIVLRPVRFYGRYISFYENGRASLERINSMDYTPEKDLYSIKNINSYDIKIVNLSYNINGRTLLKNINMDMPEGSKIMIMGFTGSGKTTLANIISGLYKNYDGHVYLGGNELREINDKILRNTIGIISQDITLFSGTIKFNITLGMEYTDDEIKNAARIAGIDDFIESLPDKYGALIGERGINLSGGQKERIAIARVVIKNPKIIIFDDSTANLDVYTEHEIIESLKNYIIDKTAIIISNKISALSLADFVIIMKDGAVIDHGPRDYVEKNSPIMAQFYESQEV